MIARQYYLTTLAAWRKRAALFAGSHFIILGAGEACGQDGIADEATVVAVVSADEATHIALEHDSDFEPLPHALARTPVSQRIAVALAPLGVAPGDDTFTVAEKLAVVHPLLRHRVF